ncbi:MAG: hypothetical protein ACLPWS_06785 [Rhodomicrobium sp.]
MTGQDDNLSVDDAALASFTNQTEPTDIEGGAGAPATPPLDSERETRVRELIRQKHTADAVAAHSAAEAAALREKLQSPGRPQDYRTPEDYTRAVAGHAVREVGADMLARQAAQAQELAIKAAADAWSEATSEFRQKVPDFDTVAHNPNVTVTAIMADAIRESSRGPEIAYYLGKNPAEAAQIASLPPVSQATSIARLEARIGSNAVSVSRAPQPVGTLSGHGGSAGTQLEDMDFEEYRRARGF